MLGIEVGTGRQGCCVYQAILMVMHIEGLMVMALYRMDGDRKTVLSLTSTPSPAHAGTY